MCHVGTCCNPQVLLGGGRRNFFNNTLADLEYGDAVRGKRADGRNLVEVSGLCCSVIGNT